DQSEFAPEIHAFHVQQLHFPGLHIIPRKALANERDPGVGHDKSLDHADARQLHGYVNPRAVGTEQFVEHLARITRARKDQRLARYFLQRSEERRVGKECRSGWWPA